MRLTTTPLVWRQAVELMSDFLDGSLTRRERRRLEKHLAQCGSCQAHLEQLRATIAASGEVDPQDLPTELIDTLVELFRRSSPEGETS